MKLITCTVLASALFAAAPAHSAEFLVQIGSPVGTPSCGNENSGISSTPVARELACSFTSIPGGLDARAAALFGHVGGSSGANVGAGYFGSSFGINTASQFSDFVTFTSTNGATSALIAANLAFSGTMNTTASAYTTVDLAYAMEGALGTRIFAASHNGVARNDFNVVQGGVSSTVNNALFQTGFFSVPINQPLRMILRLDTGAGVGGSGSPESARSEFSNSFEVPFGIDAFVLPEGVTANAGTWLVNNRRVGAIGGVPEPATWLTLILGFGVVGASLRHRRSPPPERGPRRSPRSPAPSRETIRRHPATPTGA